MFISDYKIVNLLNKKGFSDKINTPAPTTSDAVNWLLQKKGLFVQVEYCFDDFDGKKPYFFPRIVNIKTTESVRLLNQFSEPDEAKEYGIGYVLETLI